MRHLVLGPPGTGKTTRLLQLMEQAMARGVPAQQIAFVSFTRAAVREARDRATTQFSLYPDALPYFRTLHSLCFHELGLRRNDVFNKTHLKPLGELLGEELTGIADIDAPAGSHGDGLMHLDHYARVTLRSLQDAWHEHGGEIDWWRLLRFSQTYEQFRRDYHVLDFTEMLSTYVEQGDPVPVQLAFIDEAQDLTPLQWRVVWHAFGIVPELYVGADDDQCQPGYTLIRTTKGSKRLDELKKNDLLLSYEQGDRIHKKGYSFTRSSRLYTGNLFKIKTSSSSSECTDNHIWIVRWSEAVKNCRMRAVYLMKKGNFFRIGQCQMFIAGGGFHLNRRCNQERADAAWILRLCDSQSEAYFWEHFYSLKYRIPVVSFVANPANTHLKQAQVDRLFEELNSSIGGHAILRDHELNILYPFIDRLKPNYSRWGSVMIKMYACNLIPELMLIPEYTDRCYPNWVDFTISKKKVNRFKVFSLNVEPHHTYVADGLITHNCIYRWSGATASALVDWQGTHEVLPHSYRLPQAIWSVAGDLAARIERRAPKAWTARHGAPGSLEYIRDPDEIDLSTGTWLLLARTRRQLRALQEVARWQGVTYRLRGASSVNPEWVRGIQLYERLRAGRGTVDPDEAATLLRALGRRPDERGLREDEVWDATTLGIDTAPIWHDALQGIPLDEREYYLACLRRKENLLAPPRVRIETIHGAKGLEADHVCLLTSTTGRIQRGFELDPDSEHRVFYVGVTRARESLWIVQPSGPHGYQI